jgi:DNA-binding beta-propeller fold protein YncE
LVSQDTNPFGLYFKPDGTSFYVPGQQNDRVYQYNCSTPWSIATASFYGFVSIASQTGTPYNCFFKPDGTKMYLNGNGSFFQYALGTAWDVTTASYEKVGSSLPAESIPYGIYIKDDGLRLWAVGLVRQSFLGYDFT